MTTKTRTAQTTHGDIEYQTVACSSCGQECHKEDAKRFVIGDVVEYRDWSGIGKVEYNFDAKDYQMGWACPYCTDEGPIKYPQSDSNRLTGVVASAWATVRDGMLNVWREPVISPLIDVLFVMVFVLLVAVFLMAVIP